MGSSLQVELILQQQAQMINACIHVWLEQRLHAGLPSLQLHVPLHSVRQLRLLVQLPACRHTSPLQFLHIQQVTKFDKLVRGGRFKSRLSFKDVLSSRLLAAWCTAEDS